MEQRRKRLFVDMDGTLAVFQKLDTLEALYEQGYFLSLPPIDNVLNAVKNIIANNPEIDVHILSAVLSDSKFALEEKNEWLDRHLPELPKENRIFTVCGEDKKEAIIGGVTENDYLLDDYTKNLTLWSPPGQGIKLLNGINHTKGTWRGDKLSYDVPSDLLARQISSIVLEQNNPKEIEFTEKIFDLNGYINSSEFTARAKNYEDCAKFMHTVSLSDKQTNTVLGTDVQWQTFLSSKASQISQIYNTSVENLNIYATLHNDTETPHCHIIIWSEDILVGTMGTNKIKQFVHDFESLIKNHVQENIQNSRRFDTYKQFKKPDVISSYQNEKIPRISTSLSTPPIEEKKSIIIDKSSGISYD